MNKQRILSNLLILGSGRMATMVISALYLVVVTRYLGPVQVGELAFAEAIVGLLGQVNAMGMETFLIREIAREPQRTSVLISTALLVRAAFALPVPLVLGIYVHIARINAETRTVIYLVALGMVVWSFSTVLIWMLQALEKMSLVAMTDVIFNVAQFFVAGVIIVAGGHIVAFAAVGLGLVVGQFFLNVYWARPYFHFTRRISLPNIREVVFGSLAFWAKDVTMTVYTFVDAVILGSLAGTRAVGFYSPPSRVFAVALSVPNVVGNATLPLLSRLGVDIGDDFIRVSRKTLTLLILCGIPLTVSLATFAGPVISILFGPAFQPAVPVLVVLSLCLVPMFLNSQFAQILTARDHQWRWTGIMVVGSMINVVINLIFIPVAVHYWHNGALGAAISLLITELFMMVYGILLLRDVTLESSFLRISGGALIAGAVQSGVVLFVGPQWLLLIVGETLGLGCYVALVILLGALSRADVKFLWRAAWRRAPKAV